jgi:hypothetical protein
MNRFLAEGLRLLAIRIEAVKSVLIKNKGAAKVLENKSKS